MTSNAPNPRPIHYVGCWTMAGDKPDQGISMYRELRPSWLVRHVAPWLLPLRWFDEPKEMFISDPVLMALTTDEIATADMRDYPQ